MNIQTLMGSMVFAGLGLCSAAVASDAGLAEPERLPAQHAVGASVWTGAVTEVSRKLIVRNESYEAVAGVPLQVGVRWAIREDCSTRPFNVRIIQRPRFGEAYVQPVNFTVPTASLNSGYEETMRRCAGLPTIGQAIFYRAPKGRSNYVDSFAIETSTGLRFNYRIRVLKPSG